jgi:hypothetical protein
MKLWLSLITPSIQSNVAVDGPIVIYSFFYEFIDYQFVNIEVCQ